MQVDYREIDSNRNIYGDASKRNNIDDENENLSAFTDIGTNNALQDVFISSANSGYMTSKYIAEKAEPIFDFIEDWTEAGTSTISTKDIENPFDFMRKQNYVAFSAMTKDVTPEMLGGVSESYSEIRDSKNEGYKQIESSLSEEEQRELREYALSLLSERIENYDEIRPSYGDCKNYYNNGSLLDWVLTHPVNFALEAGAEAIGADWYNDFSQGIMGKDGVFTLLNIPAYIEESVTGQNKDELADDTAMLHIHSIENIDEDVETKKALLAELQENIDNPEKFAELYYQITDGVNFDADNVNAYKNQDENAPYVDTIIGRDYISENYKVNEIATNIAFEVNKNVGTQLCKMIPIPVLGTVLAGIINTGVTCLDEATNPANDEFGWDDFASIALKEGARTVAIHYAKEIASSVIGKITGELDISAEGISLIEKTASRAIAEGTRDTGNAFGAIVEGDAGTAISSEVQAMHSPKTFFKSIFDTAVFAIKSLF